MISTAENPPQDRYGSENPTALSKHDQVLIQTCRIPDFLPAPVRGNIHWQTPCVDSGPDQQDRRARGGSSHTTHRGDEHHNSAVTVHFIHRCKTFQGCVADFAGRAFHATGVHMWGNAGESSCLCHSPGTHMLSTRRRFLRFIWPSHSNSTS